MEAILHMQVVKAYLTTITLLITILSSSSITSLTGVGGAHRDRFV